MTSTLAERAVVGRRITLTYYRDLELDDPPAHPGIITSAPEDGTMVWVRLDGKRYTLAARTDFQGLTYLDDVVPVPALPMGRFTPTAADMAGVWEDVALATVGEDGEDLVLLTDAPDKARTAAKAYDADIGVDTACVDYDKVRAMWAVFEWQPEDSEKPWTVTFDAQEGVDQAVRIHYLPTA